MCEFCHEFNLIMSLNKSNEEQSIKVKYYSCFVEDTFYKGIYSGRISHHIHKLNYCPECGKKLNTGS